MNEHATILKMPAEYAPHAATLMIWPIRPGSWPYGGKAAQCAFLQAAEELAAGEQVIFLADAAHRDEVTAALQKTPNLAARGRCIVIETDDAWARDICPTFLTDGQGTLAGVDWAFNAWGGAVDGLYQSWARDDACAAACCKALDCRCIDAHPFVLEGGSIHSDGEGTILTTEACLLSAGRNPAMSKAQIEERLCATLGADKVVWLPRGIFNDETNEHVDNVCAFTGPAEVVLAWTDDENDPQYPLSRACWKVLEQATDAKGRRFKIHKLPIPAVPLCVGEKDLAGYEFEPGEDVREVGERLAASYVNFYIGNAAVVVPQFGDKNDETACRVLAGFFPGRKICPIPARDILLGGGNLHCVTQQVPLATHPL